MSSAVTYSEVSTVSVKVAMSEPSWDENVDGLTDLRRRTSSTVTLWDVSTVTVGSGSTVEPVYVPLAPARFVAERSVPVSRGRGTVVVVEVRGLTER